MEPNHETVNHLINGHGLTLRDIAILFGCRERLLFELMRQPVRVGKPDG